MEMEMKNILSTLMLGAAVFGAAPVLAQPARNIVLVHGAFADETSWDKVAAILGAKGYHVTQVANPLTSLADDVAATKAALAAQDGPTVLVAHSWGGLVIGEAGDDAKVKALVYVSAFGPEKGESLAKLLAGGQPSEGAKAIRPNDKGAVIVDPAAFPTVFAGDLPQAEAEALAQKQLPSNPANFEAVTEVAAWHDKPNFYVVTTEDRTVPADAQRVFASRMKAEVTEIAASHAGLISKAEDVAGVIEKAAR
jgi:pimeloyl-ACP methyl ester carboxylesterase